MREWFDILSNEIVNPDYALFTQSADGKLHNLHDFFCDLSHFQNTSVLVPFDPHGDPVS